ncbi:MAG: alpha/beta hydrolase-fold protein [Myxococcota bacterium]|nr:alpha/beta hydrolase-fold protein [Myxococcota bacterium]
MLVYALLPASLVLSCVTSPGSDESDAKPDSPDTPQESVGPPCETPASEGMDTTPGQTDWPKFEPGDLLKINSLTPIVYPRAPNQYPNSWWGLDPWWTEPGNDPWSESPYWGNRYEDPEHGFIDDETRWKCGYSYVVKLPLDYDPSQNYPVILFLHGSTELDADTLKWYHTDMRRDFHQPENQPYIWVAPIKLEIDWDPKKVQDVLEDLKTNLSVNYNRVYLTGLSMGGRGTFIVAAELPNTFAAILPLSPHHQPYSYVPLAENIAHLPVWLMHGTIDETSSYDMAVEMAAALEEAGANIVFRNSWGHWEDVGHWGWEQAYNDPEIMEWVLSWERASVD